MAERPPVGIDPLPQDRCIMMSVWSAILAAAFFLAPCMAAPTDQRPASRLLQSMDAIVISADAALFVTRAWNRRMPVAGAMPPSLAGLPPYVRDRDAFEQWSAQWRDWRDRCAIADEAFAEDLADGLGLEDVAADRIRASLAAARARTHPLVLPVLSGRRFELVRSWIDEGEVHIDLDLEQLSQNVDVGIADLERVSDDVLRVWYADTRDLGALGDVPRTAGPGMFDQRQAVRDWRTAVARLYPAVAELMSMHVAVARALWEVGEVQEQVLAISILRHVVQIGETPRWYGSLPRRDASDAAPLVAERLASVWRVLARAADAKVPLRSIPMTPISLPDGIDVPAIQRELIDADRALRKVVSDHEDQWIDEPRCVVPTWRDPATESVQWAWPPGVSLDLLRVPDRAIDTRIDLLRAATAELGEEPVEGWRARVRDVSGALARLASTEPWGQRRALAGELNPDVRHLVRDMIRAHERGWAEADAQLLQTMEAQQEALDPRRRALLDVVLAEARPRDPFAASGMPSAVPPHGAIEYGPMIARLDAEDLDASMSELVRAFARARLARRSAAIEALDRRVALFAARRDRRTLPPDYASAASDMELRDMQHAREQYLEGLRKAAGERESRWGDAHEQYRRAVDRAWDAERALLEALMACSDAVVAADARRAAHRMQFGAYADRISALRAFVDAATRTESVADVVEMCVSEMEAAVTRRLRPSVRTPQQRLSNDRWIVDIIETTEWLVRRTIASE